MSLLSVSARSVRALIAQVSEVGSLGRVGRHSMIYIGGQVFSRSLSFLLVPLFTRALTTSEYGVLALCTAVMGVLQPVLSVGAQGSVTRYFGVLPDEADRRRFVGTVFWLGALLAVAAGGAAEVAGNGVARILFKDLPYAPYLRLAVWASVAGLVGVVPGAIAMSSERPALYSLLTYGNSILRLLLSVALVVSLHRGLRGVLEAMLLSNLLFFPVYLWIAISEGSFTVNRAWALRALLFGLPLVPHNLAHWALNLSDRVVLQRYVTQADLGIYALSFQIAQIVAILTAGANDAILPFMVNRAERSDARELFTKLTSVFAFASVLLTVVVISSARLLTGIAAPGSYAEAAELVLPLALGYLLLAFYYIPRHYLFIAGRNGRVAIASVSSALLNIVWNLALAPRYGIVAAAWGTAACYLLLFVWVALSAHQFRIGRYDLVWLSACLAGLALVVVAGRSRLWETHVAPLFAPALAVGIFLAGLLVFRAAGGSVIRRLGESGGRVATSW